MPFWGAIALLLLTLAPADLGSFSINNEAVSGPEFLRRAGLGMGLGAAGALAFGWAFWNLKTWAREALIVVVVASAAATVGTAIGSPDGGLWSSLFGSLLFGGAFVWYLYAKKSVVAYYQWLGRFQAPRG